MSLRKCPHKSLSLALRLEGLLRHSLRAEVQSTFKRGSQEKKKVRVPRVVAAPELTRLIRWGLDMGVGGSVCPGRSSPATAFSRLLWVEKGPPSRQEDGQIKANTGSWGFQEDSALTVGNRCLVKSICACPWCSPLSGAGLACCHVPRWSCRAGLLGQGCLAISAWMDLQYRGQDRHSGGERDREGPQWAWERVQRNGWGSGGSRGALPPFTLLPQTDPPKSDAFSTI